MKLGPQLTGGDMHRTVEAIVEADGTVRLLEPVHGDGPRRTLVTFLDEMPEELPDTRVLASEESLVDWERPEEDEAWSHFQSESLPHTPGGPNAYESPPSRPSEVGRDHPPATSP